MGRRLTVGKNGQRGLLTLSLQTDLILLLLSPFINVTYPWTFFVTVAMSDSTQAKQKNPGAAPRKVRFNVGMELASHCRLIHFEMLDSRYTISGPRRRWRGGIRNSMLSRTQAQRSQGCHKEDCAL